MALATGAIALPVVAPAAVAPAVLEPAAPEPRRRRGVRLLVPSAAAAVLIALLLCGLRLAGVGWFVVTTPSMGTAIPVGSLVVDAPTSIGSLTAGDVVTFMPPGTQQSPHTHRIVSITSRGVRTRGDANGEADPWTLPADRLLGRVVAVLPGVGWLVRALPLLLVGGLITWGATMLLRRPDHRAAVVLLGTSLSCSAALLLLRPLVNAVLVSATSGTRASVATVVSTGLLPVRITATSGVHVDLVDGQVGVLRSSDPSGRIDLSLAVHLPPAGWALVVGIVVLPLVLPFASAALGRAR